jgi:hypothetical protein
MSRTDEEWQSLLNTFMRTEHGLTTEECAQFARAVRAELIKEFKDWLWDEANQADREAYVEGLSYASKKIGEVFKP